MIPAHPLIAWSPMLLLLVLAARTDLRSGRIPNQISLTLIALGLLRGLVAWLGGAPGDPMRLALLGLATGLALTIVFFLLGALGAGDVKLMAGVGAWVGPVLALQIFAVTALVAMAIAIATVLVRGKALALVRSATIALCNLFFVFGSKLGFLRDARQDCPSVGPTLPWAVPVLVAALAVACLRAA